MIVNREEVMCRFAVIKKENVMADSILLTKSKIFALHIIRLCSFFKISLQKKIGRD